ncbi:MAG: RNA pyrophosphohydrolase [Microthrixaceae bacterium]
MTRAATFRANVGIVVMHPDGRVAWFERADHPGSWQFPQGGMTRDETPRVAAARELCEETGLDDGDIDWVAELEEWLPYAFPPKATRGKHLGQVQRWFLVTVVDGAEPDLDAADDDEFRSWRWDSADALLECVAEFKRPVYRQVCAWVEGIGPRRPT